MDSAHDSNLSPPSPAPRGSRSERFRSIRQASCALAAPLSAEDCAIQSMPDASPVKWHLAHTTWFFETFVLEPRGPATAPFDPRFRVLFNSYYDAVGERTRGRERGLLSRPALAEVLAYRAHVDAAHAARCSPARAGRRRSWRRWSSSGCSTSSSTRS